MRPLLLALATIIGLARCADAPVFTASDTSVPLDATAITDTTTATDASAVTDTTATDTTATDAVDATPTCECTDGPCTVVTGCGGQGECLTEDLAPLLFCDDPAVATTPDACNFGLLEPANVCGEAGVCQAPAAGPLGDYPLEGEWVFVATTAPDGGGGATLIGSYTVSGIGDAMAHDVRAARGTEVLATRLASATLCVGPDGRVRFSDASGSGYRGVYAAREGLVVVAGGASHALVFLVRAGASVLDLSGRYRTFTLGADGAGPLRAWSGGLEPAEGTCRGIIGSDQSEGVAERVWTQTSCAEAVGDLVELGVAELGETEGGPPIAWTGGLTADGGVFVAAPLDGLGVPGHGLLIMVRELPGLAGQDLAARWLGVGRTGGEAPVVLGVQAPLTAPNAIGLGPEWIGDEGSPSARAAGWYRTDADGRVSLRLADGARDLGLAGGHTFGRGLVIAWGSRAAAGATPALLDVVPRADAALMVLVRDER